MSTPAGWYPQPDGRQRYWDGQRWTEHVAPGIAGPILSDRPLVARPDAAAEQTNERTARPRRFGRAAAFGWSGLAGVTALGAVSDGLSGAASLFGLFALVVALIALIRGRVRWAHLRSRGAAAAGLAIALVALVVGGATASPASTNVHSPTVAARTSAPGTPAAPTPSAAAPAPTTPPATPVTSATRTTSPPSRPAAGVTINAAGAVMPNSAVTPGEINPAVTEANIGQTICVPGWTTTVRPPESFTAALKQAQLTAGYTYKGDTAVSDYEEDHLIALELGGAPTAVANLWPEPYAGTDGARVKDDLENQLRTLVCAHRITLATAQKAIAANWWTAYQAYVVAPKSPPAPAAPPPFVAPPAPAPAPAPAPSPAPASAPVVPGNGATALCNDGTYSYAAHHQGACSHHGGVQVFYQ